MFIVIMVYIMYKLVKFKDIIKIPPSLFKLPLKEAAIYVARELYEEQVIEGIGFVIKILEAEVSNLGKIVPSDGSSYHEAIFTALVFEPILNEIVEGEVVLVEDAGLFIRLGPIDGFLHRSQIYDDRFIFDRGQGAFFGKTTRYIVRKGDIVRCRIVSIGTGHRFYFLKIGLTMRQPFLGKIDWIKKEIRKLKKGE